MRTLFLAVIILTYLNSNATITVVNGMTHEYNAANGSVFNGEITIKNLGKTPARVLFYKNDLKHTCQGETQFIEVTDNKRSAANWIELSNNEITLNPEEEITATYRLTVPKEGNFDGSFWGCVMVEEAEAPDTTNRQKGIRVRSLIRYAVQIIANFARQEKNLDILTPSIDSVDIGNVMNVNIQNTGNTLMKPVVVLELYDDLGSVIKRIEVPTQKIYPDMCKNFQLELNGVPKGKYTGVLVADCGEEDIYGLNVTVDLTKKGG